MATLLKVENLTKNFGKLCAVNKIDYLLQEQQTVGIIGPNGSGKTTFFNLLSGYYTPSAGSIEFKGEVINHVDPAIRTSKGIARTFQLVSVFESLTVWENLVLSTYSALDPVKKRKIGFYFTKSTDEKILENCYEALKVVGLENIGNKQAKELSYGDKRLLEIAVVLSLKPKALLLDEPFAGLSDHEIGVISDLIQSLKGSLAQIIIEHKISKIVDFVERLSVFHEGRLICEGLPNEVLQNVEVRKCYWG